MPDATAIDNQIVVFISSHQKEFKDLRDALETQIEGEDLFKKLLMKAELVEKRSGERIRGDITSALQHSTIYVGIFGSQYSEITVKEYREARRLGLPLLVFEILPQTKNAKRRDRRISNFLNEQVKTLDDVRITQIVARPARPGEVLDAILQRIANELGELVKQNLDIRRTVNPQ